MDSQLKQYVENSIKHHKYLLEQLQGDERSIILIKDRFECGRAMEISNTLNVLEKILLMINNKQL